MSRSRKKLGASRCRSPALGVRVPERVTWRIPHGRLIPRGLPYIIQISYANSLINNAGTERFIIPRYHRRLNTADLHANSPKDGASRPSHLHREERERVRLAASGTESGTRPSVYLTAHYTQASERASERECVRARAQREAADYFLSPVSMQQSCRGIHRVISRFFSLIDLHATSSRIMSVSDESVVNRSLGLPASRS